MRENRESRIENRRPNSGLTLIEVVIAATILIGVVVLSYMLLSSSSSEYENQSVHLSLDERAREILIQIAGDIRLMGTTTSFVNNPPAGSFWDGLTQVPPRERALDWRFFVVTSVTWQGTPTPQNNYEQEVRYLWIPEPVPSIPGNPPETLNEVDDDRDGLIDEGHLLRVTYNTLGVETSRVTLCRDVAGPHREPPGPGNRVVGFWFERDQGAANPNAVRVQIALQRRDPKNTLITREAETSASRRN